MARQQIVSYSYTCDVCGTEITDDEMADASRQVIWEGVPHVVDVCGAHGAELGELGDRLKVFIDAGRRQTRGRRTAAVAAAKSTPGGRASRRSVGSTKSPTQSSPRQDIGAIRVWAMENGHRVGDRGRIPASILAAYDEANRASKPSTARIRKSRSAKVAAE